MNKYLTIRVKTRSNSASNIMFKKLFIFSQALLLVISNLAYSNSLLDIYNEALENDPQYKAAEYTYLSGKEIKAQGIATLLPNISISGQTNWNEYYQLDTLQNEYLPTTIQV